ncbi:MAG: DivIVA domain-containing protein [Cytophagales bacterium]|nr:DivIVA domain-containing protein [Cytophagales bacterium]
MKVTPLEIRQKSFERTLRGYDKDEVNAFLLSLSQEWERAMDESKELRSKLEAAEREVAKLREVETSLFKTLKTAEDTGANVIDQANKTAELYVREAQIRADGLIHEAKDRARNTIDDADMTSKQILAEMEDSLKELAQHYKAVESHRNNIIDDLKRLANEVVDRADRTSQSAKSFNVDEHLKLAKREAKKLVFSGESVKHRLQPSSPVSQTAPVSESVGSFFDEVA